MAEIDGHYEADHGLILDLAPVPPLAILVPATLAGEVAMLDFVCVVSALKPLYKL